MKSNLSRLLLSSLATLFLLLLSFPSNAADCSGENEYSAPAEWQLIEGCYKKDKLIDTGKGAIYFWRLTDEIRAQHGGEDNNTPAAAIVLEATETKTPIKTYCPHYCWMMANEDYLPQIKALGNEEYAIWAPNNRLAHRHGTKGYIERLELDKLTLGKISPLLDTSKESPFQDLIEQENCSYLPFSALRFIEPENGKTIPSGYYVRPFLYLQSLTTECESLSHNISDINF